MEYSWPGNVRELENCLERSAVMSESGLIDRDVILFNHRDNPPKRCPPAASGRRLARQQPRRAPAADRRPGKSGLGAGQSGAAAGDDAASGGVSHSDHGYHHAATVRRYVRFRTLSPARRNCDNFAAGRQLKRLFFSQLKNSLWYSICSRKVSPNHEGTTMTSCSSFSGGPACRPADDSALTPLVADKVAAHPCYSRNGHHRFARMHLPVAPACNLQCNYCNRKFDCSNESRPGYRQRC
jgi:hypothetical protein